MNNKCKELRVAIFESNCISYPQIGWEDEDGTIELYPEYDDMTPSEVQDILQEEYNDWHCGD